MDNWAKPRASLDQSMTCDRQNRNRENWPNSYGYLQKLNCRMQWASSLCSRRNKRWSIWTCVWATVKWKQGASERWLWLQRGQPDWPLQLPYIPNLRLCEIMRNHSPGSSQWHQGFCIRVICRALEQGEFKIMWIRVKGVSSNYLFKHIYLPILSFL